MRIPFAALLALAVTLVTPLVLRQERDQRPGSFEDDLVIITPNNEAIRQEFARAFAAHHLTQTGRRVRLDWRDPGGTSEIVRYLDAAYLAAFQNYWERTLRRPWDHAVEGAFSNGRLRPASEGSLATEEEQARRSFLDSDVGCGIDLFFGGGSYDFAREAEEGKLVDSGILGRHPEEFDPRRMPAELHGERLRDPDGRWFGLCLAAFGICSNRQSLDRLGIAELPSSWAELANPRLFHEVALANPTQSGSVNRAFELLIQQQMAEAAAAPDRAGAPSSAGREDPGALAAGWTSAMRLLMKIGANARYFTDASSKIALDVGAGDAAAGVCIDFYARFEAEAIQRLGGSKRLFFATARDGASFSADPIGLLRGAPHRALAIEFMEWTLSEEGQKLWNWRPGAEEGPSRYALRRLPLLTTLYDPRFAAVRSDPEINPYGPQNRFTYHEQWTGPLFRPIAFIIRAMCIDSHEELVSAWEELIKASYPPEATAAFQNVEAVSYAAAQARILPALRRSKIAEVRLAEELAGGFRQQYRRAAELARAGR